MNLRFRSLFVIGMTAAAVLVACGAASDEAASANPGQGDDSGGNGTGADPNGGRDGESDGGAQDDSGTTDGSSAPAKPRFVDPCETQATLPVCTPVPAGFGDADGLLPVDRCAFSLEEQGGLTAPTAPYALVAAVEKLAKPTTMLSLVTDANRTATATTTIPGGPANVTLGFRWASDDLNSTAWIPQGISGSADADVTGLVSGKRIVLVSFYDTPVDGAVDRGVRIAFVDMTDPSTPKYRFALLVVPKGTAEAPSFGIVNVHAGGIAWVGDYLYAADTSHGFRVFDMRHVIEVSTDSEVIGCAAGKCSAAGYKYVVPQVGNYERSAACPAIFSWVSFDRETSPPSLVSGEYCSASACSGAFAGRVLRWPLDATGKLRSQKTFPVDAFYMGRTQVQGGASSKGTYFLSSSQPAAGGGVLYRANAAKKNGSSAWSDSPEDLMVDLPNGLLWGLSEAAGARFVYAVDRTKLPAL